MPRFTVEKGKRYRARINLGLLQSIASNDMVAEKLRDAGFTDVVVVGSGSARTAEGVWPRDSASADIPDEVSDISVSPS
jgi:hypothetical protein